MHDFWVKIILSCLSVIGFQSLHPQRRSLAPFAGVKVKGLIKVGRLPHRQDNFLRGFGECSATYGFNA